MQILRKAALQYQGVGAIVSSVLLVLTIISWIDAQDIQQQDRHSFFTNTSSGLVGWWSLDDTNITDRSSNRITGVPNNSSAPFPLVPGLFSNAFFFSGHRWIDFGSNAILNLPHEFTVSTFVRGTNTTEPTTLMRWIGTQGSWELGLSPKGTVQARFIASNSITQIVTGVANSLNVCDGHWHHLAGVYDAGQSRATIYVDGWAEDSGHNIDTPDVFNGRGGKDIGKIDYERKRVLRAR